MSYDIHIVDRDTKQEIEIDTPIDLRGGTFAAGGTQKLWLNITYNYAPFFRKVFAEHGDGGIHCIEGQKVSDTIPWIEEAISCLGDDIDSNYWAPTEGNAKRSLINLLKLARMYPGGEWTID